MVVGDGAAVRVRSQQVGGREEKRSGQEKMRRGYFGYYWKSGRAQQNMWVQIEFPYIFILVY